MSGVRQDLFSLDERNAGKILVGKPGGKSPLGRRRLRWGHNIQVDVKEIKWGGIDRINLAQNRYKRLAVVKMVKNIVSIKL